VDVVGIHRYFYWLRNKVIVPESGWGSSPCTEVVCSVKLVGLFVTALVGVYTVEDLWHKFGDLKMSLVSSFRALLQRPFELNGNSGTNFGTGGPALLVSLSLRSSST